MTWLWRGDLSNDSGLWSVCKDSKQGSRCHMALSVPQHRPATLKDWDFCLGWRWGTGFGEESTSPHWLLKAALRQLGLPGRLQAATNLSCHPSCDSLFLMAKTYFLTPQVWSSVLSQPSAFPSASHLFQIHNYLWQRHLNWVLQNFAPNEQRKSLSRGRSEMGWVLFGIFYTLAWATLPGDLIETDQHEVTHLEKKLTPFHSYRYTGLACFCCSFEYLLCTWHCARI